MEEKPVSESMTTVNIKPDYPPSEYCASEPPPAYHKPQTSAVQITKIVAVTIVLVSFILGSFLLASAYVTANASCKQLEEELELISELADRFDEPDQNQGPLQPEALIQEEPKHKKRQSDPLHAEESKKNTKEIDTNSIDNSDSDSSSTSESEEEPKVHFKLPLQLDFDDLAGSLIAKNQRSKMNCIVEKKRAEEVVDHQPKTIRLPFGLNLTTDPRYEKLTGERMVIICESGNMQSAQPEKPQEDEQDDDNEGDTIMIQPVMIPIPQTAFHTHMPQQMPPMMQQQQPQIQIRPLHPMETMRPPMPPMRQPIESMRQPIESMRQPIGSMRQPIESMRQHIEPMRPMGMEPMRPPMRLPMDVRPVFEQSRPTMEQIIAFRQNIEPVRQSVEPERQESEPRRQQMMLVPQQVQIQVQPQQQGESSPNPIIQHIIQQIIAQKIMEHQRAQAQEQEPQSQESREQDYDGARAPRPAPEGIMSHGLPIPEEILSQLNRLPNNERVIVAVSEPESSEEDSAEESVESQEVPVQTQEPRESAAEMNERQIYARRLPVNIPVNMMQQQIHEEDQEPQAAASEETRPHYVQPRSVSIEEPKSRVARSANPLLPEKRVKRCACDCSC